MRCTLNNGVDDDDDHDKKSEAKNHCRMVEKNEMYEFYPIDKRVSNGNDTHTHIFWMACAFFENKDNINFKIEERER